MRKGQKTSEETKKKISEKKKQSYELRGEEIKQKFKNSYALVNQNIRREKTKQTCLERYGVENPGQSEKIKNRRTQTNLERYGVEYASQSEEIKSKVKQTYQLHYGVDHPMKNIEFVDSLKKSNFEKYGVSCILHSTEIKEKVRQSNLERYGVEYSFQAEEVKEKSKQTCLIRYGTEYASQSEEIQSKMKQTCTERYGFEYALQAPEVVKKRQKTCQNLYGVPNPSQKHLRSIWKELTLQEWWDKFETFVDVRTLLSEFLTESNIYLYTHRFRPDLILGFVSTPQQHLIHIVQKLNLDFIINDRKQISPLELDIYIPSCNLGIEVNGLHWHSEIAGGKSSHYHLIKTEKCKENNIRLLQFWDYEITHKSDLCESIIKYHTRKIERKIFARKCELETESVKNECEFFDNNHLQGYIPSSHRIGLSFDGEFVAMMSFKKPRFSKKYQWELLRFASLNNYSIPGAASKLFQYRPEGSIISYSDKRYSTGNLYSILGFTFSHSSRPSYWYVKNNYLENRILYQKHKLGKIFDNFDPFFSEWENMKRNGYDRVWDCGTDVWTIS